MNREDAERLRRIYAADIEAERALADDLAAELRATIEAWLAVLGADSREFAFALVDRLDGGVHRVEARYKEARGR